MKNAQHAESTQDRLLCLAIVQDLNILIPNSSRSLFHLRRDFALSLPHR